MEFNNKLRVMIAEDDNYARSILEDLVTDFGYEVCSSVNSGTRLISEFMQEKKNPDIVLLDIGLKQLDGLTAIKKILNRPHNPLLQIIIITGSIQFEHLQAGYEVDSIDYINKPYDIERIEKALSKAAERIRMKQVIQTLDSDVESRSRFIEVFSNRTQMFIDRNSIVYVAKTSGKILLYLNDGSEIETNYSIDKIKESCNSDDFIITKRGYMINSKYIQTVIAIEPAARNGYVVTLKVKDSFVEIPLTKKSYDEYMSIWLAASNA